MPDLILLASSSGSNEIWQRKLYKQCKNGLISHTQLTQISHTFKVVLCTSVTEDFTEHFDTSEMHSLPSEPNTSSNNAQLHNVPLKMHQTRSPPFMHQVSNCPSEPEKQQTWDRQGRRKLTVLRNADIWSSIDITTLLYMLKASFRPTKTETYLETTSLTVARHACHSYVQKLQLDGREHCIRSASSWTFSERSIMRRWACASIDQWRRKREQESKELETTSFLSIARSDFTCTAAAAS